MRLSDQIENDLQLPKDFVRDAIENSRTHVKKFSISKRNGSKRVIYHPSRKLKTIQYWLIHNIFSKFQIHECACGFVQSKSILDNAKAHSNNKYLLKIDLLNFFPSIVFNDLKILFQRSPDSQTQNIFSYDDTLNIIRLACFYSNDSLPIGYPSSPIISNIVMHEFDQKVSSVLSETEYGESTYTRYADDIVISTNYKNTCRDIIYPKINEIITTTKHPNIRINNEKTKFGSSRSGSALVTGLRLCKNGHITIHRKQKDHIRLLLSLYSKNKLNEKEQKQLIGHLAYCSHVAPAFYTTLQKKFFKEIHTLKSSNRNT